LVTEYPTSYYVFGAIINLKTKSRLRQ